MFILIIHFHDLFSYFALLCMFKYCLNTCFYVCLCLFIVGGRGGKEDWLFEAFETFCNKEDWLFEAFEVGGEEWV